MNNCFQDQVQSMQQEAEFRLNAALKERCLGKDKHGLQILDFERELHTDIQPQKPHGVYADLILTWNLARSLLGSALEKVSKKTDSALKSTLEKRVDDCADIDGSFRVDAAYWLGLSGAMGEAWLYQVMSEYMPSQKKYIEPSRVPFYIFYLL